MDNVKQIAISKISDLMSRGHLVIPKNELWMRIYYNVGLSGIYDENKSRLKEIRREENWEVFYENNDRTFSGLLKTFEEIDDMKIFIRFINEYLSNINENRIFSDNIDKKYVRNGYFDIAEYIGKYGSNKALKLLSESPSFEMKTFRSSLNLLNFDLYFTENNILQLNKLLGHHDSESTDYVQMTSWLEESYPNISDAYRRACKMASEGNPVECLSNCRSVLTGVFSYQKDEGTKWLKGLQKACIKDKNIEKISSPNKIRTWKNGCANDVDVNKRYNYPRFKTIDQIYSFTSDLGPHLTEGNIVDSMIDYEIADMQDAMMGLRFTEAILIWHYQSDNT